VKDGVVSVGLDGLLSVHCSERVVTFSPLFLKATII